MCSKEARFGGELDDEGDDGCYKRRREDEKLRPRGRRETQVLVQAEHLAPACEHLFFKGSPRTCTPQMLPPDPL
jgi:hypothetical protein